jgi:hypothetical protein
VPASVSFTSRLVRASKLVPLLLELTDRDAERWLRHVQALGGAAEVELLSHDDEVA